MDTFKWKDNEEVAKLYIENKSVSSLYLIT